MIKAIIFDAGGVMLDGSTKELMQKLCDILGLDPRDFEGVDDLAIGDIHLGKIDMISWVEKIYSRKLTPVQQDLVLDAVDNNWKPNKRMFELAKKLRNSYLIGILSNAEARYEMIAKREDWWKDFDAVVLSHKVHMKKPDTEIYKYILDILGVLPDECVFVDDVESYLPNAQKMGIKTILFKDYFQLVSGLKELGVGA